MYLTLTVIFQLIFPLFAQPESSKCTYFKRLEDNSFEGIKQCMNIHGDVLSGLDNAHQPGASTEQFDRKLSHGTTDVVKINISSSEPYKPADTFMTVHCAEDLPSSSEHSDPCGISQTFTVNASTNNTVNITPFSNDQSTLKQFVEKFKRRRSELRVSQKAVGKALAQLKISGAQTYGQSTISAFENFDLSMQNMASLRLLLQAWLEEVDGKETNSEIMRTLHASRRKEAMPSPRLTIAVANQLGSDKKYVQKCFENRRAKQKRDSLKSNVNSGTNSMADPMASTSEELDTGLQHLRQSAEHFKRKRLDSYVSQANVAKAVARSEIPGVSLVNKQTTARFENFEHSRKRIDALKSILRERLKKAEESAHDSVKISSSKNEEEKKTIFSLRQERPSNEHFRSSIDISNYTLPVNMAPVVSEYTNVLSQRSSQAATSPVHRSNSDSPLIVTNPNGLSYFEQRVAEMLDPVNEENTISPENYF